MKRHVGIMKRVAVALAVCLSTAIGGAYAAGPQVESVEQKLIELTQRALQTEEVLENLVYQAYLHDGKIGEAVKGRYQIQPEAIIPWRISEESSVSVVKVRTTKGKAMKMYTFAFIFSEDGLRPLLLFPGGSNVDPTLFNDVYAPAKGFAQAVLKSDRVNIKDTNVLGRILPSGWDEEWLWVNEKGKTYRMRIAFSTGGNRGGTIWTIE